MFGLTPFERKSYDLFNAFHDFENDFFGENALQSFKTDIKDAVSYTHLTLPTNSRV